MQFLNKSISFFAVFCISFFIQSQTVTLNTSFDGYAGTTASAPSGWYLSWNAFGGTNSFYFSPGNFGTSAPSYKFGQDSVTIITPPFLSSDSVRFWIKGNSPGGPFNVNNQLILWESPDSSNWTIVEVMDSLPSTGTLVAKAISATTTHLKFVYDKISGNLAIDDISVEDYVIGVPTASFYNSLNACMGDTFHFQDASTILGANIISWAWNFGDASPVSNAQNPSHYYAAEGPYTVTLNINCDNATFDDTTFTIFVRPVPVANIGAAIPLAGCAPLEVSFFDSSTISSGSIASFSYWYFGNGDSSTTTNDPVYTYNSTGTYDVTLVTFSQYLCSDEVTETALVSVDPAPVAGFSYSAIDGVVSFNNTSTGATNSYWYFDDGTPVVTTISPSHEYTSNGTYQVVLVVSNGVCADTIVQTVEIIGLGVDPIDVPLPLNVSPNPSRGLITVDINQITSDNSVIKVYSIIGKEIEGVFANQIGTGLYQIDLSSQVDGFYFVRVYTPTDVFTWRVALSR